jgi:hypothetical protein
MGGGGNGGRVSSVLAAATSALHDLALLRDFGRIEVLFEIFSSALSLAFSAGVAGVVARWDADVDFCFRSGSRGSGLFDAMPGVVGPFAKSICLTDLFRLRPPWDDLMNDRCFG